MENLRRTLEDLNESENSIVKNGSFIIRKSIDGSSHSSYFQHQKIDSFYRGPSPDHTPSPSPENCWEKNNKNDGNSIATPSGSNSDFDEEDENEYIEHLNNEN
jgi:hypothetical protein